MECSKHILVITLQYLLRFAILVIVIIVIASYVRQIVDPYDDVGTFDKEMIDKWEKCPGNVVLEDSGLLNYSEFHFSKNHFKKIKNNVTTL